MHRWGSLSFSALFLLAACSQEIQVIEDCAAHDVGTRDARPPTDTGVASDTGARDAGFDDRGLPVDTGPIDAGPGDTGPGDGGQTNCAVYCIDGLSADLTEVTARQVATLTPSIQNPSGTALSYYAKPNEVLWSRGANRPDLDPTDITISLNVDPNTGQAAFSISQVPSWFFTTTFNVRVYAKGPGANDPETYGEVAVTVRGNILFAANGGVLAVGSDGVKTSNVNPNYNSGELASELVGTPRALHLSRDGTLLLYDSAESPDRILRLQVEGEDLLMDVFDDTDGNAMPLLSNTQNASYYTLAEDPTDGRVFAVDNDTNRSPRSRIVIWNADGTYNGVVNAAETNVDWSSAIQDGSGNFLVTVKSFSTPRLERINATTGTVMEVVTDMLPDDPRGVIRMPNGDLYVTGEGFIVYMPGGTGVQNVSPLPFSTSTVWRGPAPYYGGRILVGASTSMSYGNIGVISGRDYLGAVRPMGVGGSIASPSGMAYLD